jgi:hypothetical protein
MAEKQKRSEPIKTSLLKIAPQPGVIVIDVLSIQSKVERDLKKKSPELIISDDAIKSRMKQVIESSGNVLDVWDEHPDQAIIVALPYDIALERELRVGDKIAYHRTEHSLRPIVYNKRRYYAIFPSEILFRYLTDQT